MTLNLKDSKSSIRGGKVEKPLASRQLDAVIHAVAAQHAMPEVTRSDSWYQSRRAELKQQLREIISRKKAA